MLALILGGTKGLGLELAKQAKTYGAFPILVGRTAPSFSAPFIEADLRWTHAHRRILAALGNEIQNTAYIFWVAGIRLKGNIADQSPKEILNQFSVTVVTPLLFLREFHRRKKEPYHLITVGSTTVFTPRKDETVYRVAKIAQVTLATDFHHELIAKLPGSKNLIVNPGGMKTPFWDGSDADTSGYLDPADVAAIMWNEANAQASNSCLELRIPRSAERPPPYQKITHHAT